MTRARVAAVSEIAPGSLHACVAGGTSICLARTSEGAFYALRDLCSHEQTPLSDGDLVGDQVECPLHGSRFDLATGEPTELPAWEPVQTFPVVVDGDDVLVDVS